MGSYEGSRVLVLASQTHSGSNQITTKIEFKVLLWAI